MGIFDFFKNTMSEASDAQMEASKLPPQQIVGLIKSKDNSFSKMLGYCQALKLKTREMDDYELTRLFRNAYQYNISMACTAIYPELERRGLAQKMENGTYEIY